ncbi:MAG: VWA domain-containing protein [Alphaproteobacteria bacterium]|nr:VWA domain-containing protein [Alphaproteobacteria bacterium]
MSNERPPIRRGDGGVTADVQAFLWQVAAVPNARPAGRRGRLLFGIDATASRQPTWDTACQIQSEMFRETAGLGGLEVQLVFYRGFHEMKATSWVADSNRLAAIMGGVQCRGGQTQMARLLRYAIAETKRQRIDALVFIGDCLEEAVDIVAHLAGELGLLGVPCFMFHEGADATAMLGFRQIATLTRGAYCRFDAGSAAELRQLLAAVAVYAAGGRKALADFSRREGGAALLLAQQMKST